MKRTIVFIASLLIAFAASAQLRPVRYFQSKCLILSEYILHSSSAEVYILLINNGF